MSYNSQQYGRQETAKKIVVLTDQNYVDEADRIMKNLNTRLTTSKIRSILTMVSDIYNDVRRSRQEKLDSQMQSRVQYLRLHIAYEAGRDKDVKTFVSEAGLLEQIKAIGDDKTKLIRFCHYMEALVAYHRFYGGKD